MDLWVRIRVTPVAQSAERTYDEIVEAVEGALDCTLAFVFPEDDDAPGVAHSLEAVEVRPARRLTDVDPSDTVAVCITPMPRVSMVG